MDDNAKPQDAEQPAQQNAPPVGPEVMKAPEQKTLSVGQLADALSVHIITATKGNMPNAVAVANLIAMNIEHEYKFLLTKKLDAQYAALEALKASQANQNGADSNAKPN